MWIGTHEDTIEGLKAAGSAAKMVFDTVRGVIECKKHIRSRPYSIDVSGSGNVVFVNSEGSTMGVTKEVAALIQSKVLDTDLHKIVSPLYQGCVDRAELVARDDDEESKTSILESTEFQPVS